MINYEIRVSHESRCATLCNGLFLLVIYLLFYYILYNPLECSNRHQISLNNSRSIEAPNICTTQNN
jgi:hypothetical protein